MSRYEVKESIKAVIDSIDDAIDELPSSPYSCSAIQLQIATELQTSRARMMQVLSQVNLIDDEGI